MVIHALKSDAPWLMKATTAKPSFFSRYHMYGRICP